MATMPPMPPRPLEVRLREYAAATRGMVPQLEDILQFVDFTPSPVPGDAPIRDAIRFYTLVADDLDKILRGEELKPFIVTGTIG